MLPGLALGVVLKPCKRPPYESFKQLAPAAALIDLPSCQRKSEEARSVEAQVGADEAQ